MQVQWKKLLGRMALWLASEISLNFVGLDHLADYTEFLTQISSYQEEYSKLKSNSLNICVDLGLGPKT